MLATPWSNASSRSQSHHAPRSADRHRRLRRRPLKQWPNDSYVTRLTWQATSRDKFRIYIGKQMNGNKYEGLGALTTVSASHRLWTPVAWTPQVKWSQATTNRLMLDAAFTMYDQSFQRERQAGFSENDLPQFKISTGVNSGTFAAPSLSATKNYQVAASATYVTGSHAFKSGFTHLWGNRVRSWPSPNAADILQLRFLIDRPSQVVVRNTPIDESVERLNADFGVFAQDAWTLNRLTVNMGDRYDYFNAEVPDLSAVGQPEYRDATVFKIWNPGVRHRRAARQAVCRHDPRRLVRQR